MWHALAESALPDSIDAFMETKQLLIKKHDLLTSHGIDALEEIETINDSLYAVESELNQAFPRSDDQADDLFADLGSRLHAIYRAEVEALNALKIAV